MTQEMFGPYRLEELLGRGGMGEVHRAHDTVRGRTVALKRLLPGLGEDRDFRERFRRESQLVARLREGHVIPIHDFGEIDGRLYIDMRLVEGTDLGTVLARSGPLPPDRAVRVLGQVARALDAAHADGLVHRDVKPSNVLLSDGLPDDDYAYLVDFGIVGSVESNGNRLTATGTAIGTLEYMAPERFLGDGGDRRVDVYALGCVLHEMLTGARPFAGTGPAQMWAHAHTAPPRPSQLRPGIPPGLDAVVAGALAKDPADRVPTAGELAVRARAALAAAPTEPGTAMFPHPPSAPPGSVPPRTSTPPAFPVARPPAGEAAAPTRVGGVPHDPRRTPPPTRVDREQRTALGTAAPPPPGPPPARRASPAPAAGEPPKARRRTGVIALVAVAVLALGGGVAWALSAINAADDAASAAADDSTPAPTGGAAVDELSAHLGGDIGPSCDGPYAGDETSGGVLASAECSGWTFNLYPDPDTAVYVVQQNTGGANSPDSACDNIPATGEAHFHTWSGSNGRSGTIGCQAYDDGYTIEFTVDGIPVVVTRGASPGEDYATLLEEANQISGQLQ
ncbi:serine/threonine-protein kinase [Pseudonocardia hydrocarbonoxydans]|uniref:non-specific serine/threonine protein kinase n=1 Tax=Pseudonocardia hydrocarbonoxydans TaxID=76726 RepID=A0A4Y3WRE5_9PSEU|nr:serine/threonine-protein kinase [Pseudonocardia hydrocarbonoxydans]GEC20660.1 hypothetical protein PHY01_29430 [Pseudonocardia hydrocarbonoxydans]